MDKKLKQIMKGMPNVNGNTLLVLLIRWLSLILGMGLIILGGSLVIAPFFQFSIVDLMLEDELMEIDPLVRCQMERIMYAVGCTALVVGAILMVLRRIATQLIVRNVFIMDLRDWYDKQLAKQQTP